MTVAARYSHIDFYPTMAMRREAAKGLALRKEFGRGGLSTAEAGRQGIRSGVARAVDIVQGDRLAPDTWRSMRLFFLRHKKDALAKGSRSRGFWGDDYNPSAGWVAHLLWGGSSGRKRAEKIVAQMVAADEKVGLKPRKAPRRKNPEVPEYVQELAAELEARGYAASVAYPIAWSIACKYGKVRPSNCTMGREEYFSGR